MRMLIAITPAMYQQILTLFVKERRPSIEVETTDLANLNPEVERFGPDLVICHEASTERYASASSLGLRSATPTVWMRS